MDTETIGLPLGQPLYISNCGEAPSLSEQDATDTLHACCCLLNLSVDRTSLDRSASGVLKLTGCISEQR